MSGSKNFGVRSPPDPPRVQFRSPDPPRVQLRPPDPPRVQLQPPDPPRVHVPAGDPSCVCTAPADGVGDVADWQWAGGARPGPGRPVEVIPPQLLRPIPEPPPPPPPPQRRPALGVVPSDRRAEHTEPTVHQPSSTTSSCPFLRTPPSYHLTMFEGDGDEDVHPYIRVLDTPSPPRSILVQYLQPLSWSIIGGSSAFAYNMFAKKPMFAGIQRHVGFAALGWLGGVYIQKWLNANAAETDAVLRHYIQLHPEDFPVPEKKKFGEILQPWSPLR